MNEIKNYLNTVCEQIRFQKAHDIVKKELQNHIIDQTDAFIEQGIEKEIAVQKAIAEMGDPVAVGTELDRVHRPKLEWNILLFVILLSFAHFVVPYFFLKGVFYTAPLFQNSIILLIYIGIMIAFYHIDFTILANHSKLFYSIYTLILFFTNGFTWKSGYFMSMDFTKPAGIVIGAFTDIYFIVFGTSNNDFAIKLPVLIYIFPIILVGLLYHCRAKSYNALFWCCCSIFPILFFCYGNLLKIPCIIVAIVSLLLILISITKNWFAVKKYYAMLIVGIVTIVAILFMMWLNTVDYSFKGSSFYDYIKSIQIILQSNIKGSRFIGEGNYIFIQNKNGLLIDGIDFLKQFIEYFPAYLLHCYGYIVLLPIVAIYFFFIVKGFLLIKKQKSQLGFMTATAILLTFFIISIWNIISNSGILVIDNPLGIPFFSTSDSVNIVFFAMIGMLLSVFRTGHITSDKYITKQQKIKKKWISISENHININICITIPFLKKKQNKTSQNP